VRDKVAMLMLGFFVFASPAFAQSDDAAYCAKLGDYALRYAGNGAGEGGSKPDVAVTLAIDDCQKGKTAAGIAALEKKIRSKGFTLPKR